MKILIIASILYAAQNLEIKHTAPSLNISLKPIGLAKGIDSFCGKVRSEIHDTLYGILAQTGRFHGIICVNISATDYNLSYKYKIFEQPSIDINNKIDKALDKYVKQMEKDLSHAIIRSSEFQKQFHCHQGIQEEDTK